MAIRILHITNYYHEGFGYQENYLPLYQKRNGNNVLVLASDYYSQFPNFDITMEPVLGKRKKGAGVYFDNGVKIIRVKSVFSHSRPGLIYFKVARILKEFKPDVVHVHGATNMWFPEVVYYQKNIGYKIFIDNHQDFSVENFTNRVIEKVYYKLWRSFHSYLLSTKSISAYLPITSQSGKWLNKRLGVPYQCHIMSPLGVDINSMCYNADADGELREQWGAGEKIVIVNAGKQYKEKKIVWIVNLAYQLYCEGIDVFLVLVGNSDHEYTKEINRSLSRLPEEAWVSYPFQSRAELSRIYSASDIGIWPGIPSNTIQEAMSCGVALLLPDNDIVGHLIDGNGIYLSDNNNDVVNDLRWMLQDDDKLQEMKLRSIKLAGKYSWDAIAQDTLRLYHDHSLIAAS